MGTAPDIEIYKLKAGLCKSLSDPKRLMIINELRHGEKQVGDLVKILQIPQAIVSRHLAVLRHGGVVSSRRQGTRIYYGLNDLRIAEACDLVHEILIKQLAKNRELAERLVT
ncbi:ArsR/SmtB family transcription factor [Chloroflexota bacterium]